MGAYEALWLGKGVSFKKLAEMFKGGALPSDLVLDADQQEQLAEFVMKRYAKAGMNGFGVCVNGMADYPPKLRHAQHPIEVFYYKGNLDFAWAPSVSVIGTRSVTREGLARTKKLAKHLVDDGYTIVSGLARGVDTAAHRTAIQEGGQTIAVLGTPLSETYPKENAALQREIAENHLLMSQVPVKFYSLAGFQRKRFFFPQRNITMSALSKATIIVEAGEASGTLVQAQAAFDQGRKLFILESCFKKGLSWPDRLAQKGAIRVGSYDDIKKNLGE